MPVYIILGDKVEEKKVEKPAAGEVISKPG